MQCVPDYARKYCSANAFLYAFQDVNAHKRNSFPLSMEFARSSATRIFSRDPELFLATYTHGLTSWKCVKSYVVFLFIPELHTKYVTLSMPLGCSLICDLILVCFIVFKKNAIEIKKNAKQNSLLQ